MTAEQCRATGHLHKWRSKRPWRRSSPMRLAGFIFTWIFAGTAVAAETPWPTAAWQTSTPEEQGMSSGALADLIDTVGTRMQDSLLVVRHGKIVAEAYHASYRSGIPHPELPARPAQGADHPRFPGRP